MADLIRKSDVLEAYADLYDIFDDNKAIQEELHKVFDKINDIPTVEPNSSEKPNNCEVKNYCDDCLYNDVCDNKEFFYACTSKATISKMEQVDKDTNVRSKDCETCRYEGECDWKQWQKCYCEQQSVRSNLEPFRVDEPQKCYLRKSCDHYGDKQVCGRCCEYNLYSHTKTEPQVIACPIQEEDADYARWLYEGEPQTEPQTERSSE